MGDAKFMTTVCDIVSVLQNRGAIHERGFLEVHYLAEGVPEDVVVVEDELAHVFGCFTMHLAVAHS
eukprot:4168791-Pyramimonas_sp.AAC.1